MLDTAIRERFWRLSLLQRSTRSGYRTVWRQHAAVQLSSFLVHQLAVWLRRAQGTNGTLTVDLDHLAHSSPGHLPKVIRVRP
jgi:hypothetical protein